jgi:SRSO17 transposase
MTTDEVRAAAEQLLEFHQRFAPYFGRREAQDLAYSYLNGLMLCPERKSVEPMALILGQGRVSGLQKFLNRSPWDHDDIQMELQSVFADELVPTTSRWPLGTVGVIDESAFTKQGTHSVGVARQHNGRLGKQDNCQVGVFLVGVTPAGCALLEHGLYLHQEWFDPHTGDARRAGVGVPEHRPFATKPQIAAALIRSVVINEAVHLDWIRADEVYGGNGEFLDDLEELSLRYLVEVPISTTVWTVDPSRWVPASSGRGQPPKRPTREAVRTVAEVVAALPPTAWRTLAVREGATGPLTFQFARVRVWAVRHRRPGPPIWLLVRRSLEADPEVKYYVSNAAAEEPLETLALVSSCRYRVEEFFEDAKGRLGMAQYETRSWVGWHHHMSLVALAHLFVTLTRHRLQKGARPRPQPKAGCPTRRRRSHLVARC